MNEHLICGLNFDHDNMWPKYRLIDLAWNWSYIRAHGTCLCFRYKLTNSFL